MDDSFNPAWLLLAPLIVILAIKWRLLESDVRTAGSAGRLVMVILGSVVASGLLLHVGYWIVTTAFMLRNPS